MGAQNALYKTVAPGPSKKGPPHLFTILHAFYIGFMCSPSHFFIFPTTSHHDLAHNLHLFYVHPFSFFVISHHISSRSCTHFTFVLCAPLRIFYISCCFSSCFVHVGVLAFLTKRLFFQATEKRAVFHDCWNTFRWRTWLFLIEASLSAHPFFCVQSGP